MRNRRLLKLKGFGMVLSSNANLKSGQKGIRQLVILTRSGHSSWAVGADGTASAAAAGAAASSGTAAAPSQASWYSNAISKWSNHS